MALPLSHTKMEAMLYGFREGSTKRTIDKITGKISDPIAQFLTERLKEQFPQTEYAESTIKTLTNAAVILSISEILGFALHVLPQMQLYDSTGGNDQYRQKAILMERYFRVYAGEKAGQEFIDLLWNLVPLIMTQMSDVSEEELQSLMIAPEDVTKAPSDWLPPQILTEENP